MLNNALLLSPFDIVTVPYRDLDGSIKRNPDGSTQYGLYCVLCIYSDNTFLAFKVTSNSKYIDSFTVPLSREDHPFLLSDSYLLLTKPQAFYLSSAKFLGSVKMDVRKVVTDSFQRLSFEWTNNLFAHSPRYVSPNAKGGR